MNASPAPVVPGPGPFTSWSSIDAGPNASCADAGHANGVFIVREAEGDRACVMAQCPVTASTDDETEIDHFVR